jgi:hypothetical protein
MLLFDFRRLLHVSNLMGLSSGRLYMQFFMVCFSCIYVCSLKHTKLVEEVKNRIEELISNVCILLV